MPDVIGTINSKKLGDTGFTEAMLSDLHSQVGRHHMAIVDLQVVDKHGPDVKGKRGVTLIVDSIEPAVTDEMAEHLRELMRTVYFSRGVGDQLTLTAGADEPTVEGVLAAGAKHRPHPFLPVDASQDNPICDVCGHLETAPVHSTQDTLEQDSDEDDDLEDGDDDQEEDPYAGPHDFEAGPDDSCICGLAYSDPIHGHDDGDEPWEYDTPEGQTVADPFEVPTPAAGLSTLFTGPRDEPGDT